MLTVSALVGSHVSCVCVCVCALLPGEVEDSDAIDTLGQLDGPDSPLPTLQGKIEGQLPLLWLQNTTGGCFALITGD